MSSHVHRSGKRHAAGRQPHPQRAVALREMELTVEEAREIERGIEHPTALPKLPPRDLPPGDASMLRRSSAREHSGG